MNALSLVGVGHEYSSPSGRVPVLHEVSCTVEPGEMVALTGPSGSGKSTLLSIAGLLLEPTRGQVLLDGVDATASKHVEQAALRTKIGYLFQQPNLIQYLTALENVMVPLLADGRRSGAHDAVELLQVVGLAGHSASLPGSLSGGQAQRVALCRALVRQPAVLLADEPTSGLDSMAADGIRGQLRRAAEGGVGVLIATHDSLTAQACDRVLALDDGHLHAVPAASMRSRG